MALNVGNLLMDPTRNSFIGWDEALIYVEDEAPASGTLAADWLALDCLEQEGSLIRASRWLAGALVWARRDLSLEELDRVAAAAARLAANTHHLDLFAGDKTQGRIKRAKADTAEVEYFEDGKTQAAGHQWPWLFSMLDGLIWYDNRLGIGAYVV